MGGWSTSILTFVAIYHCKAKILLISDLRVPFLYLVGGGGFSRKRGGYTGVQHFFKGNSKY